MREQQPEVRRLAILLGHMVADVTVAVVLTLPILLLGFILGVSFETGPVGLLAAMADRFFGGTGEERRAIERLEALATWTEALRDTIAGAVGLEQAIPATAVNAAPAIKPGLNLLVDQGASASEIRGELRAWAETHSVPV